MDFTHSARSQELQQQVRDFLDEAVYPAEAEFHSQSEESRSAGRSFTTPPVLAGLKEEARRRGLWNLFLPDPRFGAGLSVLDYAPLAELSGRSVNIAPEAMNCSAPDTGNMELLAMFGTDAQDQQWLEPLLAGSIRSCFSMTEPNVASSDATNIATRITRRSDDYIVSGRKWWSTGAGRIHHCMRSLGMAERALEMMVQRALERTTFGSPLARHGVVQEWIAQSRLAIEQARLLVLKAAWMIDTVGAREAASEIAAIKVAAPRAASYVLDRAIQAFGAEGVCGDVPLAEWWAGLRTLHLADGPDEVHLRSVARVEIARAREAVGAG